MPGSELKVPVALPGGGTAEAACRLVTPAGGAPGRRVVIGIPGATYDSSYFDCPVPGYSLAARMAEAGLAFLAVDRLGTGRSDPVPARTASLEADGAVAAAAVEWARRDFGGTVLLGQGLGAVIATCAAARLADAGAAQPDLLILAGAGHLPAGGAGPALLAPAPGETDGWAVARDPHERCRLLHGSCADPAVLSWDTGTRVSVRQFVEARGWMAAPPGQGPCAQVTSPVLLLAGERDPLAAAAAGGDDALAAAERPHYPRAAALSAKVIPGAGHSLALARSASLSFGVMASVIDATPLTPASAW